MSASVQRVVLVAHDNEGSYRLFERITSAFPDKEFLLVIGQGLYYKRSFLSSVIKLLREASWLFVFFRFVQLVRYRLSGRSLKKAAAKRGIGILKTMDINSPRTTDEIARFGPDLLVSLFTMQIYKDAVLSIPRLGAISSHPSLLPEYRGLEVFFWVLANEEKETGVSVFFLNEKIDDGDLIRQEPLPIRADHSVESLYSEITEMCGNMLVETISELDAGTGGTLARPTEKGSYYGMPDREAFRRFRRTGRGFF